MTILFLIENFFHNETLQFTYSVFGAILLVSALLFISNVNRVIVVTLLLIGSVCFYIEGAAVTTAITGFGANTNILSLFLLIPLIGTFMSTAGYLLVLKEKVQEKERKGRQHPYRLSYFLTATIGIILNYGSIAIVKQIAEESFSSFKDKKLTLNIMRAFGFCMLWSPYFVNVGLILVLFDLSWFDIGFYGFILAVISVIISWLMFRKISFADDTTVEKTDSATSQQSRQSLVPFIVFCVVLISLSFILDYLLDVNMLTVVSLLALIFPFVWGILTKIVKSYIHDVVTLVENSFLRLKNELAIFISAGYFGVALAQTEFGATISAVLFDVSFGSIYLLSFLIVFLAIVLAQIGIHPIIIVIGIGSSLSPENFDVSPVYMALVLLIAWASSTQMSPFSGQVLLASNLIKQSPTELVKQNYQFALILAVVLTTVIYGFLLVGWI
ncbi:hypothetical protein BKP35_10355 [Anaerobacillus arseniciselenatis]|uniref:C4-dicarboxylate ABC transporter n=2 Tax=Anaerobacillus arseniciselenatis TaxID=85682 RepID=A0A1S2LKD6_9BACI|nr:hypothetical protein BKP35_10355 [Anaerobacillus arseniciselenatis]